jgi:hypothetical protein
MKRFVFLLLTIVLFSFNYGCYRQKQNSSKETTIKECKNPCSAINDLNFCSRICEKEILNTRWKFLGFEKSGSAWFYDLETLSTFYNSTSYHIVSVWIKKYIQKEKDKM